MKFNRVTSKASFASKVCMAVMFLLIHSSCSLFVKKIIGLKNPKVESKQTLLSYLHINKIPLVNQFSYRPIRDTAEIYSLLLRPLKDDIIIFKNDGFMYCFKGQKRCGAQQFRMILANPDTTLVKCSVDPNSFADFKMLLEPLSPEIRLSTSEYYFILYWGKYYGKKNSLKEDYNWLADQLNRSDLNSSIVMVNCDLQEEWGLKEEKHLKVKFKLLGRKSGKIIFGKIPYKQ